MVRAGQVAAAGAGFSGNLRLADVFLYPCLAYHGALFEAPAWIRHTEKRMLTKLSRTPWNGIAPDLLRNAERFVRYPVRALFDQRARDTPLQY